MLIGEDDKLAALDALLRDAPDCDLALRWTIACLLADPQTSPDALLIVGDCLDEAASWMELAGYPDHPGSPRGLRAMAARVRAAVPTRTGAAA